MGSSFTSHNDSKSLCSMLLHVIVLTSFQQACSLLSLTCGLHLKTSLLLLCLFLDSHPLHPLFSALPYICLVLTHCLLCDELHHENFLQVAMGAFCSTFLHPWALCTSNSIFLTLSCPVACKCYILRAFFSPVSSIPSVFVSYWILSVFLFFH